MDFELNDDAKPVCSQPYTVPTVQKSMLRKEFEILLKLGVIEKGNDSEWGAPSFAQLKEKTNRMRLLSDFRNLNR